MTFYLSYDNIIAPCSGGRNNSGTITYPNLTGYWMLTPGSSLSFGYVAFAGYRDGLNSALSLADGAFSVRCVR
jgi:hypothetical protein